MTTNPVRHATTFWIEAGSMSGGARHQVELPNDLAEFFDDGGRGAEEVLMRVAGGPRGTLQVRPLKYRGTDYGQWTDIWRLGLPTRQRGGLPYAGRVIRFDRVSVGGNTVYEVSVADSGSPEAQEWLKNAQAQGQTGTTGGHHGRMFGYW